MGLRFTTVGALKLASMVIAVAGMASLILFMFERVAAGVAMALVAALGCLAAVLIIRDEDNKKL